MPTATSTAISPALDPAHHTRTPRDHTMPMTLTTEAAGRQSQNPPTAETSMLCK
jgi:hypothetical protein